MSLDDVEKALQIVVQYSLYSHFPGGADDGVIAAAELALGMVFPPTYRRFLRELGSGSFDGEEFYGLVPSDPTYSGVPNLVWLTLQARSQYGLPSILAYIYDLGDGTSFYLDASRANEDGEYPVVAWLGVPRADDSPEVVANDFGEFFLEIVGQARDWLQEGESSINPSSN